MWNNNTPKEEKKGQTQRKPSHQDKKGPHLRFPLHPIGLFPIEMWNFCNDCSE
jgi:hypothetical protein